MKKLGVLAVVFCIFCPGLSLAEDFLGAPVMPGGKVILSEKSRLEKTYDTGYDDAIKYYRDIFKDEKNIKFWDRKTQMYIEDQGSKPWHSITILKEGTGGIKIVMVQDNWTWILGTLTLRFIGVSGVLVCLYIAMAISGAILSRITKVEGNKQPVA